MDLTQISPDEAVYWKWGFVKLNATIVFTWVVMAVLVVGSWIATRKLTDAPTGTRSRWQSLLETVVDLMRQQIREIADRDPNRYLLFVGTLFLFIGVSALLTLAPGYVPPTASLSTTAALAGAVFVAIPIYGITGRGLGGYLRQYVRPNVLMLPFNIMSELSRTLALAVRLFGNTMSTTKIVAIMIAVAPLLFPAVLRTLGLVVGLIQAYIFAVLAMVYIASADQASEEAHARERSTDEED